MRRSRFLVTSIAVFGLLTLTFTSVVTHATRPEDATPESLRCDSETRLTACLFGGPAVINAPFSAVATTTWHPRDSGSAGMTTSAHYFRDRVGRIRVEQRIGASGFQRIIVTPDPTTGAYILDRVARTASAIPRGMADMLVGGGVPDYFVLPVTPTRSIGFFRLPAANTRFNMPLENESLADSIIDGVRVTGFRYRAILPLGGLNTNVAMVDETWVSPELRIVIHSRGEDSQLGTLDYAITKLSRADQPRELFEVPSDYALAPATFPFRWDNPRAK